MQRGKKTVEFFCILGSSQSPCIDDLLVYLVGVKQQLLLQLLSFPLGFLVSLTPGSGMCIQLHDEGLWFLQDTFITNVRSDKNEWWFLVHPSRAPTCAHGVLDCM